MFLQSVFESALGEQQAGAPSDEAGASHDHVPTPSVRGATLARPEGYCLCRDPDYVRRVLAEEAAKSPSSSSASGRLSRSDFLARMGRDRGRMARALLPRRVLSTARKYPLLHRGPDAAAGEDWDPSPLPFERRVPSVQFLNCDLSQALKMITPKFACGPATGPVTIFIVAATTEDGCFVSGRRGRYEVGHLYPLSGRDMLNDMSPVCIATGTRRAEEASPKSPRLDVSDGSDDDSSHDTSDDDDRSVHCVCEFQSGDPFAVPGEDGEASRNEDDPTEDRIRRGTTGPGLWHCYTAVFDGEDSRIRVDGAEEPRTTRGTAGLPGGSGPDSEEEAGTRVGDVPLDGLSIGSDHLFNESLCYGEFFRSDLRRKVCILLACRGLCALPSLHLTQTPCLLTLLTGMIEGECGEGSISELAVFRGRLDPSDLERVESHLMKRHGILTAAERLDRLRQSAAPGEIDIDTDCGLREDDWTRQANALIVQRRPWRLVSDPRVPLRVAANHPSVSWRRRSVITGDEVRVARIGAKSSNGSSDW